MDEKDLATGVGTTHEVKQTMMAFTRQAITDRTVGFLDNIITSILFSVLLEYTNIIRFSYKFISINLSIFYINCKIVSVLNSANKNENCLPLHLNIIDTKHYKA
jgi:ABC-type glutathione transport system ATPase component